MFEHWKRYNVIFVTGPQRSGTRIASQIIAHDTGHTYVDEEEFKADHLDLLEPILRDPRHLVIQCPALQHFVHRLQCYDDLVVLMKRDVEDIIASQERIDWDWEEYEKSKYPEELRDLAISRLKYYWWEKYQRDWATVHTYLYYNSLSAHPLWVPKEQRVDFTAFQTRVDE